jgi:hypothetical protein
MKLLPKVRWVLFQDDRVRGQFFHCDCGCKNIQLDVINQECNKQRFLSTCHETIHFFFDLLPRKLSDLLDFFLDITWGNQADVLITKEGDLGDVILYEW